MRITEKHKDLEGIYTSEGLENIEEGACKLGQLEDIEEIICFDMFKVFQMLFNGIEVLKNDGRTFHTSVSLLKMNGEYVLQEHCGVFHFFKDYGTEFALAKEELL